MVYELADTLTRLIECVDVPAPPGIVVTSAEIELPLEVTQAVRDGRLVFYGSAPHSRWKAGVLPEVNLAKLRVAIDEEA